VEAANVAAAAANRHIVVKRMPDGLPKHSDFEIVSETLPPVKDGELLLRTKWLTVDPYMRSPEGIANPKAVGKTMMGGSVSEVLESKAAGWNVGDLLVGFYGWQEYCISNPSKDMQFHGALPVQKWDETLGLPSTALGVLGMTGYTAYFGLLEVGQPRASETVVVSAAAGAVGQVVGQIAKIQGCRVVGIAGGTKKCAYCKEELGFDECVDYKSPTFRNDLSASVPNGIDVYFENVGGDVLDAVIPLLNQGCRIPICGFVSQYNSFGTSSVKVPMAVLQEAGFQKMKKGASSGFRFFFWNHPDFLPKCADALKTMSTWIKEGRLKYRESVTEGGLDSMIDAFTGMLKGENFGKAIIKF
jgi:NADPH-dependent curcumin reductase CurA